MILGGKLYALAGALLALAAVFGGGYSYGAHKATVGALRVQADRDRAQQRELGRRNDQLTELEREHETRVAEQRESFARTLAEERAKDAAVVADLRAGNRRLRLAVVPRVCPATPNPVDPAPGGADEEARAELAPEAASALFGIVSDGDEAIRQLTELQAYTDQLYRTCQKELQ